MQPSDRTKYDPKIDVLRACAFLMVASVHFAVTDWTDSIPDRHLVIDTVALGLIHTGWLGVPLFLFISGYSLGLGKTGSDYRLDVRQFFANRVLRIYPIWIVCILLLMQFNNLSGGTVIRLLLMQTQDLPPKTAFNIAWSIQLEWVCYLLFPVLLIAVRTNKFVLFYVAFLLFRIGFISHQAQPMWTWSYDTVFGEGTVFLTGIFAASLPKIKGTAVAWGCFLAGTAMFCGIAIFIWKMGGYQEAHGDAMVIFFALMPELLAGIFFLMVRGYLAIDPGLKQNPISAVRYSMHRVLMHVGQVSYSGYMFSLFVMSFVIRAVTFVHPGGWAPLVVAFTIYITILIAFATVTFNVIEMPFLKIRRVYALKPSD
jgi:peptidoglycan/LPS O-acetylase OafA/YrhL